MIISRIINRPFWSICSAWTQKPISLPIVRLFSCLSKSPVNNIMPGALALTPSSPLINPSCGLKIRGSLQLRCKDCYLTRRDGEVYVMCPSFPRHNQKALRKRLKYRWILSHASQTKYRPY